MLLSPGKEVQYIDLERVCPIFSACSSWTAQRRSLCSLSPLMLLPSVNNNNITSQQRNQNGSLESTIQQHSTTTLVRPKRNARPAPSKCESPAINDQSSNTSPRKNTLTKQKHKRPTTQTPPSSKTSTPTAASCKPNSTAKHANAPVYPPNSNHHPTNTTSSTPQTPSTQSSKSSSRTNTKISASLSTG